MQVTVTNDNMKLKSFDLLTASPTDNGGIHGHISYGNGNEPERTYRLSASGVFRVTSYRGARMVGGRNYYLTVDEVKALVREAADQSN